MTTQSTASFKKQLLAQRAGLLEQLRSLRDNEGRAEASAEHFAPAQDSTAQVSTAREMELTLDARESTELGLVDAALRRIEDGIYGLCIDCGATIPAARLHAAPEALRCIACQEKAEQLE
jgi:DnaK suppressor protein